MSDSYPHRELPATTNSWYYEEWSGGRNVWPGWIRVLCSSAINGRKPFTLGWTHRVFWTVICLRRDDNVSTCQRVIFSGYLHVDTAFVKQAAVLMVVFQTLA
ncbi:hypothetical protein E1B28_007924 [Marasmius oreades]|uniref:Uncharacterized protein n=1 Tax=Marasmius oreades TaxID=181124 RepID=A0A9P7UUI3_9AGAR|nr:uncharacterized protein E1B28_007924 [Marasmius oreades]KAG7094325.1 hypothetical protein E1B28_007924 [Marasmius oreades]